MFVAFCYKHDICISRIVTQNTLKCAISGAEFQNFSGEGTAPPHTPPQWGGDTPPNAPPLVAFGHSPPRPLSKYPGLATDPASRRNQEQTVADLDGQTTKKILFAIATDVDAVSIDVMLSVLNLGFDHDNLSILCTFYFTNPIAQS